MAVIINEFEVVPEPSRNERQKTEKTEEKGGKNQPPTDYEVKQMLQRRCERSERVSAN